MNIGAYLNGLTGTMNSIYEAGEADAISRMLLSEIAGTTPSQLILQKDRELSENEMTLLNSQVERLRLHEPVQYIINKAWFADLMLYVDPAVLIPRPETEELVQWIIDDIRNKGIDVFERGTAEADQTRMLKIIDIGTGSGCIALALKQAMPKAEVWGCDKSEAALNIARRNGSNNNVRVDFQGVDFLDEDARRSLPSTDIIVSNPPYIPINEKDQLADNVVSHEPHLALFVPSNDPLLFYKALADFGRSRLYDGGKMYVEIHEERAEAVATLFRDAGYHDVVVRKDMQQKPRMVRCTR